MEESANPTVTPEQRRRAIRAAVIATAFLLAVLVWFFWPVSTTWPSSFCQPMTRILSSDVQWTVSSVPGTTSLDSGTPAERKSRLISDVRLARAAAPTAALNQELASYLKAVEATPTLSAIRTAISEFDTVVAGQLQACGILQ